MKSKPIGKRVTLRVIALLCAVVMLSSCAGGLQVQAADLMEGVSPATVEGKAADTLFLNATARFSLDLFRRSIVEDNNALVSPLSVLLALSMTANGADKQTLTQMETVLGDTLRIDDLNRYLYTYCKNLPSGDKSKFTVENSIWFRDDENRLTVVPEFLQKNADYYGAAAYKAPFDDSTLKDINAWVKKKTDGMIEKILDTIQEDAVMYLLNAIVFDAEWQTIYNKNAVIHNTFTAFDGTKQDATYMASEENWYLSSSSATGFMKPYAGDKYRFIALLPKEGLSVTEYVQSLTGREWMALMNAAENTAVDTLLPKFSYDYTIKMNDALKSMGMANAFDGDTADFSRMAKSTRGNIYIGEVLHKTFIAVDERGTKAGAVTKVEMNDEAAIMNNVRLDRPFVYAIVDTATNLPLFMGTVLTMAK